MLTAGTGPLREAVSGEQPSCDDCARGQNTTQYGHEQRWVRSHKCCESDWQKFGIGWTAGVPSSISLPRAAFGRR